MWGERLPHKILHIVIPDPKFQDLWIRDLVARVAAYLIVEIKHSIAGRPTSGRGHGVDCILARDYEYLGVALEKSRERIKHLSE